MAREIDPQKSPRAESYRLWMNARNPMVTFFKTFDVTALVRYGRKNHLKFNMLMVWCIGKAAKDIPEFYTLPVGNKLIQYDTIAVNTIVRNKAGGINSCDILFTDGLRAFNERYLESTSRSSDGCADIDLSEDNMVIGTSAVTDTEIDGAVGMDSGIFNNPFLIWGKYRKRLFRYYLTVSFQFHHTQMDGAHAGRFLANFQNEINSIKNCRY